MNVNALIMNKLTTLFFLLLLGCLPLFSQQIIDGSISHDALTRTYKLYVPASYDGTQAYPLVLNFHGLGSNAEEQLFYSDFRPIADTAGFLVVHPEGTKINGNGHWNVNGIWHIGSTADDVGFAASLLDTLESLYNIDSDRVYATGMSNGGYMAYELACRLSDRIAAVASVTGSMTPTTLANCRPKHPTPIMQIHGTNDGTVPYEGAVWTLSMEQLVDYWIDLNECDTVSVDSAFADVNPTDGSTVSRQSFLNGEAGSSVEFLTVDGGDHTWPGTFFVFPGTNLDIKASQEIWNFFSQYDLASLTGNTTSVEAKGERSLDVYPNPASQSVYVQGLIKEEGYALMTAQGQQIRAGFLSPQENEVELAGLAAGLYFLRMQGETIPFLKQ